MSPGLVVGHVEGDQNCPDTDGYQLCVSFLGTLDRLAIQVELFVRHFPSSGGHECLVSREILLAISLAAIFGSCLTLGMQFKR